jgi:Skp family chaperone for outer membrane proteins
MDHGKNFDLMPAARVAVIDGAQLKDEAVCFKQHEALENMLSDLVNKARNFEARVKEKYEQVKSDKSLTKQQRFSAIEKIEENWAKESSQYKIGVETIKKMDLNLSKRLQKEINQVIESVARRYKIDVVLNTHVGGIISVFYSRKNVDITDLIVRQLNKTMKPINLKDLENDG